METTYRLEPVCRAGLPRPDEAVALVQSIGRRMLRLEPDGDGCLPFPTLASLLVTESGDVTWSLGERDGFGHRTARLAQLLMRLYDPAGSSGDRRLPVHLLRAVAWATGMGEGAMREPAEFLRALDGFGPADNTATIRRLVSRWQATTTEPDLAAAIEEYEIDIDEYCGREMSDGPSRSYDHQVSPKRQAKASRWLALPAAAAVASVSFMLPGLLRLAGLDAGPEAPAVAAYRPPAPAPAAALEELAGRGIAAVAWPLTPAPPRRARQGRPVGPAAGVPPVQRSSAEAGDDRGAGTKLGRLLAGDGRHKVRPFPRPNGT